MVSAALHKYRQNIEERWLQVNERNRLIFPDKNTGTLSGAMIGVNCAQACEEFP
jgi:hypothetical protein